MPRRRDRDENHRAAERLEVGDPLHTRSTVFARVNKPFGRTSRTTITAAKMNESMYWLWLVGSAAAGQPTGKADRETAERRRNRAIHPSDNNPGEHDNGVSQREVRRDQRVSNRQHYGDDRSERA